MIEYFFTQTITVVHPALVPSGYGDGTDEDFAPGTSVVVKGWLDQLSEQEIQSATRDASFSTHVARLPKGTAITASDRVIFEGDTFEVSGRPNKAKTPFGVHHVRVPLRFIDG